MITLLTGAQDPLKKNLIALFNRFAHLQNWNFYSSKYYSFMLPLVVPFSSFHIQKSMKLEASNDWKYETALGKEFNWEDYKNQYKHIPRHIIIPDWNIAAMPYFIEEDMSPFKQLLVTMRLFDPHDPMKDENHPLNDVLTDLLIIPQTNNDMKSLNKAIELYPQYENVKGCLVSHT